MTMRKLSEMDTDVVQVDAKEFTDIEKQLILQVVARDEEIRMQQKNKLDRFKEELRKIKKMGVPDGLLEGSYGHVCKRCRRPLGLFCCAGKICPNCGKEVCKACRIPLKRVRANIKPTWNCRLCFKCRDIRAVSGAWFYSGPEQHTVKKEEVYGSMMIKNTFSVLDQQDYLIYKDPVWSEIVQEADADEGRSDERDNCPLITDGGHSLNEEVTEEEIEPTYDSFEKMSFKGPTDTASVISDHNNNNYNEDGNVTLLSTAAGEVQIGLKYEYNDNIFVVQIYKAKDLIPVDIKNFLANPYVKVYLSSPSQTYGKKNTKAQKNTLNPDFDEVLSFNINHEELVNCTCSVQIRHSEFSNNNILLGKVDININEFLNSEFSLDFPPPQWYSLHTKTHSITQLRYCGELLIGLQYKAPESVVAETKKEQRKLPNPTKGEFYIKLIQAKGLDWGEDTFCCKLVLVRPDKITTKIKSNYVTATDPLWGEEYVISNISWAELEESYLQICLRAKQKDSVFVAGTRLGLGMGANLKHDSFGEEVRVWQSMLDHTNDLQDFCIPLRNSLDSVNQVKEITDEEFDRRSSINIFSSPSLDDDALSITSSGSVFSIYTNAGGLMKNVDITGEMLFSIKHDINSKVFRIHIQKAKGLAAVNEQQRNTHPYCKLYLIPDKTKSTKSKTMHKRRTVNPLWDETITYDISKKELLKKTLQISIWNHDRFGRNDFLGMAQVNINHYSLTNNLEKAVPVWYTLQDRTPVSNGGNGENKGELKVALFFDHEVINVRILQANGLDTVDSEKLPNPFVKCYLLPDKSSKGERRTSVQKETIAPVWDEKFSFKGVEVDDLYSRVLEVTVWDYNTSGHQFLGGIRLGLEHGDEYWHDCFGKEFTIWEMMMTRLGILAEYTIPLRATMTSRKGRITRRHTTITPILEMSELLTFITAAHLSDVPEIHVSLQYLEEHELDNNKKKQKKPKGSLKVHLKEAKYLPVADDDDVPSSFCKAFVHSKKKKSYELLTKTYLKSANPIWDKEMIFSGFTLDKLRLSGLEILVYDEHNYKEKNLIGYVRLGSGGHTEDWDDSRGVEVELWRSMLNNPSKATTLNIPLRIAQDYLPADRSAYDSDHCDEDSLTNEESEEEDDVFEEEDEEEEEDPAPRADSPRTIALRYLGAREANVSMLNQIEYKQNADLASLDEEDEIPQAPVIETWQTQTQPVEPGEPPFPGAGAEFVEEVIKLNQEKKKGSIFPLMKSVSRNSISSNVSSTDSSYVYRKVPVRGDIQFGMKYDHTSGLFEVHIFQASDLSPADSEKETSDAFCKVYLLPDKSKSGKRKTNVRRKTLNPEWEEVLQFKASIKNLRARAIWVSVWSLERMGHNVFLGEVRVNMNSVIDGDGDLNVSAPAWYPLCDMGEILDNTSFKGEISFSIMFEDMLMFSKINQKYILSKKQKTMKKGSGKVKVHIKEARNLPAGDWNGFSDPFCKCHLLPTKESKSKRKTPIIMNTLSPKWDYQFEYKVDYEDLATHGIEFAVWDWDRIVYNDFLGCCRINLGTQEDKWNDGVGIEVECWQHLIDHPNTWKDFVIPLRSKMESICG